MYIRPIFNRLIPPLRPFEREILSVVQARLSGQLAALFGAQVERINYVQRRDGGAEIGLYTVSAGNVVRDPSLRLPDAPREWRLARVRITGAMEQLTATVFAIDGHVSSIEFDRVPPQTLRPESVSMHVEVLEPRPPSESSARSPNLPHWLQPYADRFGIANIDPPLTLNSRAAALESLHSALPDDYLDFINLCDGAQIGVLSLLGLREAYETRTHGDEYLVLGQVNGEGILAVRKPGPDLVFIHHDDGSITDLGDSLKSGIETAVKL